MASEAENELTLVPASLRADDGRGGGLAEAAPTVVQCVALASDWRGYQKLAARLAPAEVAALLQRYYELTDTILAKHADGLPAVCDWIADELVVCIPVADAAERARALDALLAFSRELLAKKTSLPAHGDVVPDLDVGLASGTVALGLFGPPGRQKLAFVGEAVSRARAAQAQGKKLREVAARDRILLADGPDAEAREVA